jgi:two-component system, chemotaxis family, protein-glutamate methylesterase/glutaminase
MIRVLVVDDSSTIREFMKAILEEDPEIAVVGEGPDGDRALSACKMLRPDVVTMDLVMPGGGVTAIQRIMNEVPTPIVIVSALASQANDATVFDGLAAGARAAVRRPPSMTHPEFSEHLEELLRAIKTVAGISLVRRRPPSISANDEAKSPSSPLILVGVGASTGGPAAVMELLRSLPKDFAPSIALVQHLTPGFELGLVEWLGSGSHLPVRLAAEGMRLPWLGTVVAPDGVHLTIDKGVIKLTSTPAREGQRPSVDELFDSMAGWRPRACAGVLLSGMGRDGAEGLARLRKLGGRTMVQSEETCVVFGMPGVALQMGAADVVLRPSGLAEKLATLARAA